VEEANARRAWDLLRPALNPALPGWAPHDGWLRLTQDGRAAVMSNQGSGAGESTSTQLSLQAKGPVYTCRCASRDGSCPDCQGITLAVLEKLASPLPQDGAFSRMGMRDADRAIEALRQLLHPSGRDAGPLRYAWEVQMAPGTGIGLQLRVYPQRGSRGRAPEEGELERLSLQFDREGERALLDLFRANLKGGYLPTDEVLLALVGSGGLSRDDAYRIVQSAAMRAWDEGIDFRALLMQDPEVASLDPSLLDEAFDLSRSVRNIGAVFSALDEIDL
jgi:hypothetical protein